jgi:hypothetical protein
MTQLPSAPGQQITPTAPDGGLNIKKQAIQQAAAQKAAAQEKAQQPPDEPIDTPVQPNVLGEPGTGFEQGEDFGVDDQLYGAEKSLAEEAAGYTSAPGVEMEAGDEFDPVVHDGAELLDDKNAAIIEAKKKAFEEQYPLPEGWVYAYDEQGNPVGSHPEGEEFGAELTPEEVAKKKKEAEDYLAAEGAGAEGAGAEGAGDEAPEDEDNALKTQAEKELQSILSGEGEFGMTDEELANQEAIIQKAAQQAKADLSQQMSGRGLGMSGIAGAGFGNIDAQSITAMQDLKFKNAQLAIDEKLNTLNSISKLYGHLLSEEDRMKIADMQFGLENQKFEYQKEADAESNWWADMNDMLALTGSDSYSAEALEFAQEARKAGYSPAEITDALETFDDDDPGTEGKEVSVTVNKNSDLYKKIMGEDAESPAEGEGAAGGIIPQSQVESYTGKTWPEIKAFHAYQKDTNFSDPAPGWEGEPEDWPYLTKEEREAAWQSWLLNFPGEHSGTAGPWHPEQE